MMRRHSISSWQFAATYIGTVVGAGFASGQEILQFFVAFGHWGLLGIIIATLGFSCLGFFILYLGYCYQPNSHQVIFLNTCGPVVGRFLDGIVTLFLFGAMVVMQAGVGAIFQEHLGIPPFWGVVGTMFLALFTVFYGLAGVMAANTIIIPFMVILILGICTYSLNYHGVPLSGQILASPELAAAPNWLLATILYLSYNLILSVPVLGSMGKKALSLKILWRGALTGGLGLGLLILMIALVQMAHFPEIKHFQVPMLFIVQPFSKALQTCLAILLWAEIFTTLIANLYGFASRSSQICGWSYQKCAAVSLLAASALSGIGFSTLVGTVYPLLGYAGLFFLLGLLISLGRLVLGKLTAK